MLRSDGEPAIQAVTAALAARRGSKVLTVVQTTPVKSSSSLGCGERASRAIGAQIRALLADVRERTGVALPLSAPLATWLTMHG